jgi:hypothetical protein
VTVDVLEALDRATRTGQQPREPLVAAITAKRDQVDHAILTGRMSAEQYQFEAGRRAGLSDALRIIEGQQRRAT